MKGKTKAKLLSSKLLLKTPIFKVTDNQALDPEGHQIRRLIVTHAGSAVTMPVDDEDRVLLVRQYRLPAGQYLWELPAGRIDPGENALQAAKRELVEETGYRARRWTKLAQFYSSPGFLAEHMTIYLATGLTAGEKQPVEDERIELRDEKPAVLRPREQVQLGFRDQSERSLGADEKRNERLRSPIRQCCEVVPAHLPLNLRRASEDLLRVLADGAIGGAVSVAFAGSQFQLAFVLRWSQ